MKKPPLRKVTCRIADCGHDPRTKRKYWGFAYHDDLSIEIDKSLNNAKRLNILAHELFHLYHPETSERRAIHFGNEVERIAKRLKLIREDV